VSFVLFIGLVIALSAWASQPPKPARTMTWKDWVGVGIYGLLALIGFALYFQTAAVWTLGLALLFAVVALTSALRSINSVSSAGPITPRP
jgi:hypothetical protein